MPPLPGYLRYVQYLTQSIEGVPEGAPSPLYFGAGTLQYLVEYDLDTWRRLFDCVAFGAEFLYPDVSHQVMWDFLRPIEYPYPVPEVQMLVADHVTVHKEPMAGNNSQTSDAGSIVVDGWCEIIKQDTTEQATVDEDKLYLPEGTWHYTAMQGFNGNDVNPADLVLFQNGLSAAYPCGATQLTSRGVITIAGTLDIADGDYLELKLIAHAAGYPLGLGQASYDSVYSYAHFTRYTLQEA